MPATRLRPSSNHLDVRIEPGVVHVSGVVDRCTAHRFSEALSRCDDDMCIQALDLSAVEFFSSAGAWCFVDRGWPHRPHVPIIASRSVVRVLTVCDMEFLLGMHGWRSLLGDTDRRSVPDGVQVTESIG